jgi:hypothetical protein
MQQNMQLIPGDQEFVVTFTLAYLRKKKAVLIFCPTKPGCEKLAETLSNKLPIQYPEYKEIVDARKRSYPNSPFNKAI